MLIEAREYASPTQLALRQQHIERRKKMYEARIKPRPVCLTQCSFQKIEGSGSASFLDVPRFFDQKNPQPYVLLSVRDIQSAVCDAYGINLCDMLSLRRSRPIVYPRQMAIALCRRLTVYSLPEIGARFRRDHSTVMHAVTKLAPVIEMIEPQIQALKPLPELIDAGRAAFDEITRNPDAVDTWKPIKSVVASVVKKIDPNKKPA